MNQTNRGGGYDLMTYNEQRAAVTKVIEARPSVTTRHKVGYKDIRNDFIKQMGSLQRKRKSEIANENLRIYKKIQAIEKSPSHTRLVMDSSTGDIFNRDKQSPLTQRIANLTTKSSNTRNLTFQTNAGPAGALPSFEIREEKARIERQNAMLDQKLTAVKSRIPMNSAIYKGESKKMDSYNRFASKYGRQKPKLDPLVLKKVTREVDDKEPGNINMMLSMHNMSQTSLDNLSVEYNEGSLVSKRIPAGGMFKKASGPPFLRKSQSIGGILSNRKNSKASLHQIISKKEMSPNKNFSRQNSNDLHDVLDQKPIEIQDLKGRMSHLSANQYESGEKVSQGGLHLADEAEGMVGQRLGGISVQSGSNIDNYMDRASPSVGGLLSMQGRSRHQIGLNSNTMTTGKSPTLVRAADSAVMLALKSTGRDERMAKKRTVVRNKEMDLTDIISRLEGGK